MLIWCWDGEHFTGAPLPIRSIYGGVAPPRSPTTTPLAINRWSLAVAQLMWKMSPRYKTGRRRRSDRHSCWWRGRIINENSITTANRQDGYCCCKLARLSRPVDTILQCKHNGRRALYGTGIYVLFDISIKQTVAICLTNRLPDWSPQTLYERFLHLSLVDYVFNYCHPGKNKSPILIELIFSLMGLTFSFI